MEAAGGKALACVVDIRDEQQIGEAVEKAVSTFGGGSVVVARPLNVCVCVAVVVGADRIVVTCRN